jgi:carboxypeptidase C (cathepsin A)
MRIRLACLVFSLALTMTAVDAQQPPGQRPGGAPAAQTATAPREAGQASPRVEVAGTNEEKVSQTSHSLKLDGRDIKYTATTGTLAIRLDDGKVAARMFFVAYTKDGEDAHTRPVSFLYNGGPGSATV